jgi:hypothetical protein
MQFGHGLKAAGLPNWKNASRAVEPATRRNQSERIESEESTEGTRRRSSREKHGVEGARKIFH